MLEILTIIVLLFVLFSVFILLPILLIVKAVQLLFEPAINEVAGAINEVREHNWRNADAADREKLVRSSCGLRVIGRVVGAGCCVVGAVLTFHTVPVVIFVLGAYRLLKPIRQEMHDACAYRSTGAHDEPPR